MACRVRVDLEPDCHQNQQGLCDALFSNYFEDLFHILLDGVFLYLDRPTLWMATNCELSIEYLLWNATVWHVHDVTNPS